MRISKKKYLEILIFLSVATSVSISSTATEMTSGRAKTNADSTSFSQTQSQFQSQTNHNSREQLDGVARDLKTNQIVYYETHQVTFDSEGFNKKITSIYKDENKKVFAQMESDFSKSRFVPDIDFKDQRLGRTESLRLNSEKNKALITTVDPKGGTQTSEVEVRSNSVAGQGFDNFLKGQQEKLKNQDLEVRFIILPERDDFRFDILKSERTPLPPQNEALKYRVRIHNFIFRLFADALEVSYDIKTHRLLRYRGLSNIRNSSGQLQSVELDYTWTAAP